MPCSECTAFDIAKFADIKAELIKRVERRMDSTAKKELRSLLRPARKDGRKPFAGYIKEEDGSIHVLLLADASEFVYRRLKRFEPELLASFQARWPQYNIIKVTVVPRIKDKDAGEAVALGGTFRVFRREKAKDRSAWGGRG